MQHAGTRPLVRRMRAIDQAPRARQWPTDKTLAKDHTAPGAESPSCDGLWMLHHWHGCALLIGRQNQPSLAIASLIAVVDDGVRPKQATVTSEPLPLLPRKETVNFW
jgi:hypothetical protein